MKKILQDLSYEEIVSLVQRRGGQPFRARQIFEGLMQGKRLSELPVSADLRSNLLEEYEDEPVKAREIFRSKDGTKKTSSSSRTATSSRASSCNISTERRSASPRRWAAAWGASSAPPL